MSYTKFDVATYHTFPNAAEQCSVCGVYAKSGDAMEPTCPRFGNAYVLPLASSTNKKEPRAINASDAATLDAFSECVRLKLGFHYNPFRPKAFDVFGDLKHNRGYCTRYGDTLVEALAAFQAEERGESNAFGDSYVFRSRGLGTAGAACDPVGSSGSRPLASQTGTLEDGWYLARPKHASKFVHVRFVNGRCPGGFPASDYEIQLHLVDKTDEWIPCIP